MAANACAGASASEPEVALDVAASAYEDFEGPTIISPDLGDVLSGSVEVEVDPGSVDPTGETSAIDYHGRQANNAPIVVAVESRESASCSMGARPGAWGPLLLVLVGARRRRRR